MRTSQITQILEVKYSINLFGVSSGLLPSDELTDTRLGCGRSSSTEDLQPDKKNELQQSC
jgi:hypothetical protein